MRKRLDKTMRSVFADHLSSFIELRQLCGYKFKAQADILLYFDRYLCKISYKGLLTQELALRFATSKLTLSKNECAQRYQVVRHFADYLSIFEPETPRLDHSVLVRSKKLPVAFIFTDEELTQLLNAARDTWQINPLRGITLYTMVGLAISTGLRLSEIISLDIIDVRLDAAVLNIRCSKFRKDRLVPLHPTTVKVLKEYLSYRSVNTPAFFLNMRGKRFSKRRLDESFKQITRSARVGKNSVIIPTFHDLRHTFAVRRLVTWYREGIDVQSMLPLLATYMGHVHYSSTAYYLTATSELLGLAAERYDAFLKKEETYS